MTRSGKYILQLLYFPFVLTSFIVYVLYFDRLREISLLIINIAPSVILVGGAIIAYSNSNSQARALRLKGEEEQTLTITNYDIYVIFFLMIAVFVLTIFLPLLLKGDVGIIDYIQGVLALPGLYWIRNRYFKYHYEKNEQGNFQIDDTITINCYDSMKLDAISFATSIAIVALPGFITQNLQVGDILQASIPFLGIYWINLKYFKMF